VDDPWGYGNSLEWATSSPPPKHNFIAVPRIRSERPAWDFHHGLPDDASRGSDRIQLRNRDTADIGTVVRASGDTERKIPSFDDSGLQDSAEGSGPKEED
jgi:cytochrome c oxidase subunit 1